MGPRTFADRVLAYLRGQRPVEWYVRRGLRLGERTHLEPPFYLEPSHCWLIDIGDDVVFAPRVSVLVHDASTKRSLGYSRIARTRIGDRVFVGHGSLIMPGTTIGSDSIVGAGSVVTSDVPPGSVVAGNPARVLFSTDDYLAKNSKVLAAGPSYEVEWTVARGITTAMKDEMRSDLESRRGFVR